MKKYILSLILILLLSANCFGVGKVIVQNEWTYENLAPSVLSACKGLSFIPADTISLLSGSAVLDATSFKENLASSQGTISLWYYPYNYGNAGQTRYLLDCLYDGTNRIRVYVSFDNSIYFSVIGNGTTRTCSTSFASILPFQWCHIVATWSKNVTVNGTSYSYIYLNGSGAGQTSATVAMTSIPSTFSIGSDYLGKNSANGIIAYKISKMWMSSAEVTADYNSGAGSKDFFTVCPNCVALGLTTESSTGIKYHHIGKAISSITDGASYDSLVVTGDATKSFASGDRVAIYTGTGDSAYRIGDTKVVGNPTTTGVNIDNGGGADVGLVENVGRFVNTNGLYNAVAANNTIFDCSIEDLSISFYIKANLATQFYQIVGKSYSTQGYTIAVDGSGFAYLNIIKDGSNSYLIKGTTSIKDGKWHHIAVTIDRDDATNCKVYKDGYEDGTTTKTGTLANVTTITTTASFYIANASNINSISINDIKIAIGSCWSAAQVLFQATNPYSIAAGAGTITEHYACNEGTGTTITASVTPATNNLTLSNALAWNQSAFVSRNLVVDPFMENGGVGGWTPASCTFTKNLTNPIADSADGKILNTGAAMGTITQNILVDSGDDYYFYCLFKGAVTPDATSILVNGDGVAAQSITVAQAGITAGVTKEVEFCTEAGDTSFALGIGSGSVTNAESGNIDNIKFVKNYVDNGGMEGGADPPTSWVQEASATVVSDTSPHAGTNCMKITAGDVNVGASQSVTLVSGQYYTIGCYLKATAGDTIGLYMDYGDGNIVTIGTVTATTWTRVRGSFKALGTAGVMYVRCVANGDIGHVDDAFCYRDDSAEASSAVKGGGIIPMNQPMLLR